MKNKKMKLLPITKKSDLKRGTIYVFHTKSICDLRVIIKIEDGRVYHYSMSDKVFSYNTVGALVGADYYSKVSGT